VETETAVQIRFTKWGGKRHWRYTMEPLGTDQYGQWFGARAGIEMRRGYESPIVQTHDFVTLVPHEGSWIANWNPPTAKKYAMYIDVTTKPVFEEGMVCAVDLDLDVVQMLDGSIRVLDEDEFAEHQVLYGYPAEVISQAEATTAELVKQIVSGLEPFATVGRARLEDYWRA
jgi:uncharacterized protein